MCVDVHSASWERGNVCERVPSGGKVIHSVSRDYTGCIRVET